jgi:BirA family biotin operon repressor/biotin-[acetyl-CoA-carboxylase] ligase
MLRDPLRGRWLARQLHPAQVRIFARLRSTNEYTALQLEAGELAGPALIVASQQTAGRGQHANRWWSDAGSICATFVLPVDHHLPVGQVPLRAGLALAEVMAHALGEESVQVKWPNDVFVNGRKIAGLLCARIRSFDMIGIGLNVYSDLRHAPGDVQRRATSLALHLKRPPRRDELIRDVWFALQASRQCDDWVDRYQEMHLLQSKQVRVESSDGITTGICRGIDREGRLLVEQEGSMRAITGGVVSMV